MYKLCYYGNRDHREHALSVLAESLYRGQVELLTRPVIYN